MTRLLKPYNPGIFPKASSTKNPILHSTYAGRRYAGRIRNISVPFKSDLSEYTTLDLYQRLNIGNIFFITENRQGKYWMGTDKGLFLFEKDLKNYCQFNENDNLPSLRFNRNEFQETPDGVFWLGNTKGLMYLTPQMQTDLNRKIYEK